MPRLPLTIAVLLCALLRLAGAQVAVIVHPEVSTEELSRQQLLDIYAGETRLWNDDVPIVVFDQKRKDGPRNRFYAFLGRSPSRMKSVWLVNLLSGEGDPPRTVESDAEMVRQVAGTPGAIGYVAVAAVTDSVRVLMTIPASSETDP